jgi:D-alanyl-lipoteichoic acid acyltransferase DltB (MBOAT superfamily)
LVCSIAFNYAFGLWISRSASPGRRRGLLLFAVGADLAVLAYYKFASVFPLGVSFFTFTQIAFLVDAARGEAKEYDFVHYGLFVSYFPHLIAGPILHHKEMMPQFSRAETYRAHAENFSIGLTLFFMGLFKKVVFADACAPIAAAAFGARAPGAVAAWSGTLAYALQIYFDFSGYSDMALGLSRLFGVTLPLNFDSPYQAESIIDFWRRWHMTLSRFLRDYLYIPLGGSRLGPARRYLNLLITMLLGGLWHGGGWTFLVWGGLHGFYLCVNHAWRALRGAARPSLAGRWAGRLLTFAAVCVAWVFFRAKDLGEALAMLKALAGADGFVVPARWLPHAARAAAAAHGLRLGEPAGFTGDRDLHWLLALTLFCWLAPNTQKVLASRWKPSLAWAALTAILALTSLLGMSDRVSEFLYYRF